MSPKRPDGVIEGADHGARIDALEGCVRGSANEPGLLKRMRILEDDALKDTTTRRVMAAVGSGLVAAAIAVAPVLAYLGPRIDRLSELLEKPKAIVTPAAGRAP